jgi:hypothetical protein
MSAALIVMIVILLGAAIGLGIYFYNKNKTPASTPNKPAPGGVSPAATDPRTKVWKKGQKLVSRPVEIVKDLTGVKKLPIQPKLPSSVIYSISFDIYLEKYSDKNWAEIVSSGSGDTWDGTKLLREVNQPLLSIAPNNTDPKFDHQKQLLVRHLDDLDTIENLDGNGEQGFGTEGVTRSNQATIPLKTWTNIVIRIDGDKKKQETYIDGELGGVGTFKRTPTWAKTKDNWTFGTAWQYAGDCESIKIANMYFFDTYIANDDIPYLKIPSSPTNGVYSTKY